MWDHDWSKSVFTFPQSTSSKAWSKQNLMRASPLNIRHSCCSCEGWSTEQPLHLNSIAWSRKQRTWRAVDWANCSWHSMVDWLVWDASSTHILWSYFRLWEIAFHQWESCMVPMVGIIHGMLDWETPVVGQKVRPASNYGSNFSSWETTSLCGKHVWNVRMGKPQLQRWEPCLTHHGKGMWLTCQHMGMWVGHGSSTAVNEKHVWNVTSCWGVRNSHTLHGYACIHEWTFYFKCIL